ncbi:hypothetical protein SSX86_007856 [Deinandra increscens subsp. villosa]|uniref:Magnesium transporter n=1 Tax=Deinandra increscens subsp. villosa TaxID=3103831 RepID=A0AAP0DIX9_9ASTR
MAPPRLHRPGTDYRGRSKDPSVAPFVDELQRRILRHYHAATSQKEMVDGNTDWTHLYDLGEPRSREVSPPRVDTDIPDGGREVKSDGKHSFDKRDGPKLLPFEFVALEACLEAACSSLDNEARTLEQEAHPALDKLTSKISTLNLERVRQIKIQLVAITGHVQKVTDELEQLLDDDGDMAEMYLTDKLEQQLDNSSSSSFVNEEDAMNEETLETEIDDRVLGEVITDGKENRHTHERGVQQTDNHSSNDTVGRVISQLKKAIKEERYKDAAFVRDYASAGLKEMVDGNTDWTHLYDLGEPRSREVSPPRVDTDIPDGGREVKSDGKHSFDKRDGPKLLPFEFVALEACLEAACSSLDNEARTLEQEAHPALDKLTSKISTLNLECVRQIKIQLVAITGHVQKVRDELEQLLDDDGDMAEMYLTDKLEQQLDNSSSSSFVNEEDAMNEETLETEIDDRVLGEVITDGNENRHTHERGVQQTDNHSSNDTVGRVISQLKKAIKEERYKDAAFVRDYASAVIDVEVILDEKYMQITLVH